MNYELRNTHDARRTTHDEYGFTLIELVVAIGLLSIVLVFSGAIFKASIGSYRTAMAQAEIMRKLRVITEQLNADFKGIQKDAPMFIWFQKDVNGRRLDQIMFFAAGDFQSTRLYFGIPKIPSLNGTPVIGNVARIQYCHARVYSPAAGRFVDPTEQQFENNPDRFLNIDHRALARRQHLLTADPDIIIWPNLSNFPASFLPFDNNNLEHDAISLSQWQALTYEPLNNDTIIRTCFSTLSPFNSTPRPSLNFRNGEGLHMLMAEGVSNYSVQLAADVNGALGWLPDTVGVPVNGFGYFFNIQGGASSPNWSIWSGQWPLAIKFTFTLYDSKRVFRDGQTFTHIVYLGE